MLTLMHNVMIIFDFIDNICNIFELIYRNFLAFSFVLSKIVKKHHNYQKQKGLILDIFYSFLNLSLYSTLLNLLVLRIRKKLFSEYILK